MAMAELQSLADPDTFAERPSSPRTVREDLTSFKKYAFIAAIWLVILTCGLLAVIIFVIVDDVDGNGNGNGSDNDEFEVESSENCSLVEMQRFALDFWALADRGNMREDGASQDFYDFLLPSIPFTMEIEGSFVLPVTSEAVLTTMIASTTALFWQNVSVHVVGMYTPTGNANEIAGHVLAFGVKPSEVDYWHHFDTMTFEMDGGECTLVYDHETYDNLDAIGEDTLNCSLVEMQQFARDFWGFADRANEHLEDSYLQFYAFLLPQIPFVIEIEGSGIPAMNVNSEAVLDAFVAGAAAAFWQNISVHVVGMYAPTDHDNEIAGHVLAFGGKGNPSDITYWHHYDTMTFEMNQTTAVCTLAYDYETYTSLSSEVCPDVCFVNETTQL